MKKHSLTAKKQLLTLILGGVLIALIAPALVNCADPAPTKYTVKFDINGGKPAIADKTVEAGKLLTKPSPNPTKTGYTFAGWHKDEGLTQAFNFNADKITANITLYAKWTPESTTTTHTVTFNLNGGAPNQEDKTVETGTLLTKPSPDPTKTGYTFEGWYKDAGFTQAFNFNADKITANTILYAKWTPESTTTTHTVTFNLNGGAPNQEDKTVETGTLLTKPSPDPTKTGYTFAGWHKDEGLTQAFNFNADKITANITLYAKWTPESTTTTHTVTFNLNGGAPDQEDKTVENGTLLTKPSPDPTKTGYTFEGWHKDAGLTQAFNFNADKITANTILYAKWVSEGTVVTYIVTFDSNGGTNVDQQSIESGAKASRPTDPTKAGFTFVNWYGDEVLATPFDFDANAITANITLYAKWTPESTTTTYTVTFNLNGGTPDQEDKTVETGMLLTKPSPDPTKTGYTFEGWYKDAGLTQAFNFSADKITANITLYAKWTPESSATTHTVTFNLNGGTPDQEDKTVETGMLLTKPSPDPTKTGYTFEGWHKDAGLTQAFNFVSETINADITLYAKWDLAAYTVTFNLNGGTPDQEDKTVETGMLLTKPSPDPTKTGYTFEGWHKDAGLTQAFNFVSETINADITLYAKWGLTPYTVTFNSNGGTPNQEDKTVQSGALLTKPSPDPTKTGYTLEGWYKDAGLTQAFNFVSETINADITLYAKWVLATYTVTFNLNGGTPDQEDKTVENGTLLTKPSPDPTKKGHTFEGWFKDEGFAQAFNFTTDRITANTTLYAKWESYLVGIPGVNFRNKLKLLMRTAFVGDSLDPKDPTVTGLTALDVHGSIIEDLTGIEYFTALTLLDCTDNRLEGMLDLSTNTKLEELYCNDNKLTDLDVSTNTKLTTLYCSKNQLDSLDLSTNTALTTLFCIKNQLTHLDMRGMRSTPKSLAVQLATDATNLIETLKVHETLQDHAQISALKTARGDEVTIETYSADAGSTTYTLECSDYDPTADDGAGGKGVCND